MDLDVLTLSRIQFALTVMFHYIFPPLTIGLGVVMVCTEALYLKTKNIQYEAMTKFWTKIFAVNFAMGVASGIVMEFQFGTNWATYSRFVGDVFGSALAAEGIFAFFLESGFLAVLVFGWDRVSPKMHFFSTCMVALGSMFSAVWIVVANSWMQTPAGFHVVEHHGMWRAEITDFWALVFNPSSVIRLTHTLIGAFILGAFFVMSITAYYILKNRHVELAKKNFSVALIVACIASIAQLFAGHTHAKQVHDHQPAKLAAYEAHFETGTGGAPLHLFGIPDEKNQTVKMGIAIPGMLSFLVHGNTTTPVNGLDKIPKDERPPVAISFLSFHLMVILGLFFIGLTLLSVFFLWRGALFQKRWLMWTYVFAIIAPYISNQFGWIGAEVGRQPWIVQGLLKTADSHSKTVDPTHVLISIIMFGLIYVLLFAIWINVLNSKIKQGPEEDMKPKGAKDDAVGLLQANALLVDPAGASMTAARDEDPEKGKEG